MPVVQPNFVTDLALPDPAQHAASLGIQVRPPQPRPMGLLMAAPPKPSATLVMGQVAGFTAGLSGQDKQDVECTTLAAQLNSDVKVTDTKTYSGVRKWFDNYASVMSNLGWIMSFDWQQYQASGQGLSMDKVVLEILAGALTGDAPLIAKAAIDALGKLPQSDGRLSLFRNSTVSASAGKFMLGVASKQGDSLGFQLGAVAMDYTSQDTTVLWFRWKSSDLKIQKDTKTATFNQAMYAQKARATLEARLAGHINTYAQDLDLGL
jgi:hypothetical protein